MSSTADMIDQHVLLRVLIAELHAHGLREACTSPGSRNTPIVLALLAQDGLRCHSQIDERVAGFMALGIGKASGAPALVTCTSGTAALGLAPAVVEAREARVPLIVLTADRPTELRDVGAGQAIDQLKLYGAAAKWFVELALDAATPAALRYVRTLAARIWDVATHDRPGAVHVNVPLREPLVPPAEPVALPPTSGPWLRRSRVRPDVRDSARALAEALAGAQQGVVVAGRHERDDAAAAALVRFAADAGWPLLADPLSGARSGPAAIAHYDALLRGEAPGTPDVVLRVGDLPPCKPLRTWLAGLAGVRHVALDAESAWQDPDGLGGRSLQVDVTAALQGAPGLMSFAPSDEDWLARWRAADARTAEAIALELDGADLCEAHVAAHLPEILGPRTLVVASSMPVRDLEAFCPTGAMRVLCNRGANGIDGTLSTALGVAAARGPVLVLIGDVALAHDIGAIAALRRAPAPVTIVLVNNGGGAIFDMLPVGREMERAAYEAHVATPTGLDFEAVARLGGLSYARPDGVEELLRCDAALIEVRSDRARTLALREAITTRARAAARPA